MSITATITGVPVIVGNASFRIEDPLEDRSVLTFTVLDSSGTASYTRGDPVTFADPDVSLSYTGYVQSDQPIKDGLTLPYVEHTITCMDGVYNLGKRSNNQNYFNWQAGNIAVDFVRRDLASEGITIAAASHRDTTSADFNQGNLSGVVGAINGTDDGDLELALAGTAVTITESTTANFSTGTLTNVIASSNSLYPSTVSAISLQAQLPVTLASNSLYMKIWSGSMTVGTNDTLNYDIWISSTSPAFNAAVDLNFSDGTSLSTSSGSYDQNFLSSSPSTDLTSYAKDTWYTRNISLASSLNGKTINSVTVTVAGNSVGTYNVYFKNIYLGSQSGSPFFSTSATTTQVNPPTVFSFAGYVTSLTLMSVVKAIVGASTYRVSPGYSIDAVKLIGSTLISWSASTPSGSSVQVAVSYDGNAFVACTNGQPLPGLPAGSNVSGLSLYLQEIFTTGTSPVAIPTLVSVNATLSPSPKATKSDVIVNYGTSTQWNTGTSLGLSPNANGDLALGTLTRDWSDGLITGQTFFSGNDGTPGATSTESVVSGQYTQTLQPHANATSRLDFAGVLTDFIAEFDTTFSSASSLGGTGLMWGKDAGVFTSLSPNEFYLDFGGSIQGTYTGTTVVVGTTYHFKVVVKGQVYQVFLNHGTTPIFSFVNSAAPQAGPLKFYTSMNVNNSSATGSFDNLVITPAQIGTWQSPSIPLSALTTIAGSTISWIETLASGASSNTAIVQASLDGGSTWQVCTNNKTIPGLTSGVNVSSLSLIVKITLFSTTVVGQPVIGGLNVRVLGAFPSTSGTRDTTPLGNDTSITRTVGSGWGIAFDGQTWTQVGTGTTAVSGGVATISNTSGDVHMVLGTRTSTGEEATVRFMLSASTITAGMELRYVNTSNYYRLSINTTSITIYKESAGIFKQLATASLSLSTSTWYWMRFRVAGSNPVLLYGKVWAYGQIEPGVSLGIMSTTNPQWTLTASD